MSFHLLFFLSDYKINFEVSQLSEKVLGDTPQSQIGGENCYKMGHIWFKANYIIVDMLYIIFYHGRNIFSNYFILRWPGLYL